MVSKFGYIAANNHRRCLQKVYSVTHLFPVQSKTKCYRSMKLLNIVKNILQIMIDVYGIYKKCEAIGLCRIS